MGKKDKEEKRLVPHATVRRIIKNTCKNHLVSDDAVTVLREGTNKFIREVSEQARLYTIAAKRKTIQTGDIYLALKKFSVDVMDIIEEEGLKEEISHIIERMESITP